MSRLISLLWKSRFFVLAATFFLSSCIISFAAEGDVEGATAERGIGFVQYAVWFLSFSASICALFFAWKFFKAMMESDEGTPRMVEIAGFVREGANAYLMQQYKVVFVFFILIVVFLSFLAFYLKVQSSWVPFAFLSGGFFSGLAGWCGMKTATWASSRTAAGAQISLNQGLQVAFRSGAVMGLTVVGLALFDITIWFAVLRWAFGQSLEEVTVTMLCFGMGASAQALFARVGGGIFTKAADVGADLVGKVEQGIPEDDPRNPATIADNVGDNVGDVAGMGADLYESYCGSILATSALGVAAFATLPAVGMSTEAAQLQSLLLPMAIAAIGIVLSVVGIFLVKTDEDASQKALLKALAKGIDSSTGMVAFGAMLVSCILMPKVNEATFFGFLPGVAFSIIVGLAAGWLIGKWTEYSTSDEFKPTKRLAEQAVTGPATIIIGGIADGMMSVWFPVIVICVGTLLAFGFANGFNYADVRFFALGLYGVGIASVGMLSTLGITLATDAYGPIADNAGGNAEMAGLDPIVRERTDALDSLGNTTAATGKGFAIGSAALTALALLAAYVEEVRIGFERWGESVVVHQLHDAQPGLYKLSNGFVVKKMVAAASNDSDETGSTSNKQMESGHGGYGLRYGVDYETFLAMPSATRHIDLRDRWADIPLLGSTKNVGDSNIASLMATGVETPTFNTGTPLIDLKQASLPDFTTYYDASLMNPKVLVGLFVGAMSTFVFCAMTMKAVGRAAKGMVEEVRRQFREKPGIMMGTDQPDYAAPVAISTRAAQWEMVMPSLLGLITPVAVGLLLGVGGVLGLLVGTLTTGFCVAIFMANSGGAWDNAKKYIEAGHHGGKGSEAHKAGVVGDTVGDPFKDTSGPSLNILIKLMSMVSVVVAGFIVRYSLVAFGIF